MSDLISKQKMIDAMRQRRALFCKNRIEFMALPKDEKARVDEIDNCISGLINAPDAESKERTAKVEINWVFYSDTAWNIVHVPYSYKCGNCGCQLMKTYGGNDIHYCPSCGARLEWNESNL